MTNAALSAGDLLRSLTRYFQRHGAMVLHEVPLPNGRRADLIALTPKGEVLLVEVKVARGDLHADQKWAEYLPWCDQFYWALADGLDDAILDHPERLPDRCGRLIADRYDVALIREAAHFPMPPARRKAEHLRLSRLAMWRWMLTFDPDLAGHAGSSDLGI